VGLEDKNPTFPFELLLMKKIRRSPVDMENIPHYLQGFSTIPGGWEGDV